MSKEPPKPWFAARRFGYGAGVPLTWQGWAVLAAYGLLLFLAVNFLASLLKLALIVVSTLALIFISARRTEGGWHWRWGKGR
jgi:uncharacterized membrane protein YdfJ with MMPL/SSD domain